MATQLTLSFSARQPERVDSDVEEPQSMVYTASGVQGIAPNRLFPSPVFESFSSGAPAAFPAFAAALPALGQNPSADLVLAAANEEAADLTLDFDLEQDSAVSGPAANLEFFDVNGLCDEMEGFSLQQSLPMEVGSELDRGKPLSSLRQKHSIHQEEEEGSSGASSVVKRVRLTPRKPGGSPLKHGVTIRLPRN